MKTSYFQIRSGEYEGLGEKLTDPKWAPDFGPAKFVPSWGGTVTGVRKFLIAYNVNMVATKEQAHRFRIIFFWNGFWQIPGIKVLMSS